MVYGVHLSIAKRISAMPTLHEPSIVLPEGWPCIGCRAHIEYPNAQFQNKLWPVHFLAGLLRAYINAAPLVLAH